MSSLLRYGVSEHQVKNPQVFTPPKHTHFNNIGTSTTLNKVERSIQMFSTCVKHNVLVADRLGYVTRLAHGTNENMKSLGNIEFGDSRVYRGQGVYVVIKTTLNEYSANEMVEHYRKCKRTVDEYRVCANKLILEAVNDSWSKVLGQGRITPNSYRYKAKKVGDLTHTLVYFVPESYLEEMGAVYCEEMDLTFSLKDIDGEAYHPNQDLSNNLILSVVYNGMQRDGSVEYVINHCNNDRPLYKRSGNKIQQIKSTMRGLADDKVEILSTYVDINKKSSREAICIDYKDKEKLKEYGLFHSFEEAQLYNSETELAKLKIELSNKEQEYKARLLELEQEHKAKMMELEQGHKEEMARINQQVNQLKLEETKIKFEDTVEVMVDKGKDREAKKKERKDKKQERKLDALIKEAERHDKQVIRDMEYRQMAIDANLKKQEAEQKYAQRSQDNFTKNLGAGAAMVTGAVGIIGALSKLLSTRKTETTNGVEKAIVKTVANNAVKTTGSLLGRILVPDTSSKVVSKVASSVVTKSIATKAASAVGSSLVTKSILGKVLGASAIGATSVGLGTLCAFGVAAYGTYRIAGNLLEKAKDFVGGCVEKFFGWLL